MPPIDPGTEALRREEILLALASGEKRPISPATLSRWRRAYAAEGLKGLEPDYSKCGRKPLATLDVGEQTTAKRLYVQTGSVTTALRLLADSESCSETTAAAILKKRTSKHSIPRALRSQVEVAKAVKEFAKSPKRARTNFFVNPRSLTYMTAMGEERPLLVGDISERDDMSNNFLGWVEWPWGGDACSDRYGVRIFRGQNLMQIDVRSLFFQSYTFLVRLRDSYRADDIWQWVGHSYRDHFVPAIGERWERGIWASNKLRGFPIEPGHTSNEQRLGGIAALGRRVIESQSPTTKIIEHRFNFFQTVCSTIPGQIGRSRGEMERANKLWTECREGRRDPREHFLSFNELSDQIEKKLHYVNHEPVEGLVYHGVPADMYARGIAERGEELRPLAPEHGYLFSRDRRETTCNKGHAMVRYTRPDGTRGGWWFYHPDLFRWQGEQVAVYFDKECAQAGATVVPLRPGIKNAAPLHCEFIDGCPQFTLGLEELAPEMADALGRKKAFMDAVRSEYRAIFPDGRKRARVATVQDGTGQSATITNGLISHDAARSGGLARTKGIRQAGERPATRETAIALPDPAYVRRLEEQFLEAHPGIGIT
jgi:hypothetical protein